VTDPEVKRKTIGNLFIEVFQDEAAAIGKVDYLLQVVHSCSLPGSLSLSLALSLPHTPVITTTGPPAAGDVVPGRDRVHILQGDHHKQKRRKASLTVGTQILTLLLLLFLRVVCGLWFVVAGAV